MCSHLYDLKMLARRHERPLMPSLHVQLCKMQQPVHLASSITWACGVLC